MTRNRKDAGDRREEILRATVAHIEKHGIEGLRFIDVAQAMSVSAGLLVYHFQTKEAMIAEACAWSAQRDLDRLAALTSRETDAGSQLVTAIKWYAPTGRAKGWRLWIDLWAASLRDSKLRQVGRDLDLRWKRSLAEIIDAGVQNGEFASVDPLEAAWRITAVLDGLAVQKIVHRGAANRERTSAWTLQLVAQELGVDSLAT